MDTVLREEQRRGITGDPHAALRAARMVCRVEGHHYDTFKRFHPIRHTVSVEIRVCFRCFDVEAAPVGQLEHISEIPKEAFRGASGWVIFKRGYTKSHVFNEMFSNARLVSLCGGVQVGAIDLAHANGKLTKGLIVNIDGQLSDVSCKNCVKMLATEWPRAIAGDLALISARALVRRVVFNHGLASIPKCECLHVVHTGRCLSSPCQCQFDSVRCSGQGCGFVGPEPIGFRLMLGQSGITNADTWDAPWGNIPDQTGIFCPTCVEAAQF